MLLESWRELGATSLSPSRSGMPSPMHAAVDQVYQYPCPTRGLGIESLGGRGRGADHPQLDQVNSFFFQVLPVDT